MIEIIRETLLHLSIDTWKIMETDVASKELFFIRKSLDMNRAKQVRFYTVTVYRDFEEEETLYKGSATVQLVSSMTAGEVKNKLEKAFFAASFVKNPHYPLPEPSEAALPPGKDSLRSEDPLALMAGLADSLYKHDTHSKGGINSAELFISQYRYRLLNSSGIDVSFENCQGEIELITDWKEEGEGVELYNMFSFSDYCPDQVAEECRNQLDHCRLRARAERAPEMDGVPIIISGEAVAEMMSFYVGHANARSKYEKLSKAEPGKVFQGEEIRGDLITITLNPFLPNSPHSAPYDMDGLALHPVTLYEEGVLKQYHGSVQYSHYMNIPPTGTIRNVDVRGGKGRFEDFLKEPYVEILAFSDFQMDMLTGDFGGEVRLARYFDGKEFRPLTGASLSACLFDVQKEIYLSREIIQRGHYKGPKSLLFPAGHLAGSAEG